MAAHANMRYARITTDVGAAAKFYHVIWNNAKDFDNVIIHLGDVICMPSWNSLALLVNLYQVADLKKLCIRQG